MKLSKNQKILIVGLGLMGGSYAMALHKKGYHISAIDKSEDSVKYAMQSGIIDYGTTNIEPSLISEADICVFALYPHIFTEWIEKNGKYFKSGAVITDVTGVKGGLVETVQNLLPPTVEFIAAHPMAGREVYGVRNSDDSIFHDANYIVVPTEKNSAAAIELCKDLGKELGFSRISELSPEKHDEMIGFLSQLTHCIAVTLMCCNDSDGLEAYTGDSFRDLTRIARINEDMWSELFMLNKSALLQQMNSFADEFIKLRDSIKNDDVKTVKQMMKYSTERRMLFDKKE